MFDLFGTTDHKAREGLREQAISMAALMLLLEEKGVTTREELARYRARAVAIFDQEISELREQWRKDNPQEAEAADFLNKLMGARPDAPSAEEKK